MLLAKAAVVLVVGTMVALGSLAIAVQGGIVQDVALRGGGVVHQEMPPNIQHTSDVKIHLQDVDGKIQTNVPVAASRAFSPLPVQFGADNDWQVDANGDLLFNQASDLDQLGSLVVTKQKVAINVVLDVSEDFTIAPFFDNKSEDKQIFIIRVGAPSNVLVDLESGTVTVHGLVGHNEWLASINGNSNNQFAVIEISTTDAGFYPIVLELLRVG